MDENDLRFTYELKDDFQVFPTVASTLSDVKETFSSLVDCPGMPNFNPMMLLHGEQHLEVLKVPKAGVRMVTEAKVKDIADKGKGAFVTFESITYEVEDDKKTPVFRQHMGLFIRGIGGFGYKGTFAIPLPQVPNRNPCKSFEEKTEKNQAIFYRLAGDTNPLHIDPNMASIGGFERPILHGLCTYGICAKNVMKGWCDGNPEKIKKVSARFTSHVFPGETMKINTWKEGNVIIFNASTVERGTVVIQGYVELNENSAKL